MVSGLRGEKLSKSKANIIAMPEISVDCPKCGGKLWQIFVSKTILRELDDIFAIECECGYRVEFREEP